jgi:signal peptidase I
MLGSHKKLLIITVVSVTILTFVLTVLLIVGQDRNFYVVVSDSMIPNLNTGHIVLVAKEDRNNHSSFASLQIGDIIVFAPPSSKIPDMEFDRAIVHRVVGIESDSKGARVIRTKGDANSYSIQAVDFPITIENYIGKVTHAIPYLGLLLMYFDLLVRVFLHPIIYIIVGALIAVIFVVELRKRQQFLRNLNE